MKTISVNPGEQFDEEAETVNDAVNWVEVARIQTRGRGVLLRLAAGAANIDHVKVAQAAVQGGTPLDLAVDTDMNAKTEAIPYCIPLIGAAPAIAANAAVEFAVKSGASDLVISAKGAATSLTVSGRALWG